MSTDNTTHPPDYPPVMRSAQRYPVTGSAPRTADVPPSPWLRISQAAQYAQTGTKLLYREIQAGRLKARRLGGRREIRTRVEWLDEWIEASAPAEAA